jgi:hypothetical protein
MTLIHQYIGKKAIEKDILPNSSLQGHEIDASRGVAQTSPLKCSKIHK